MKNEPMWREEFNKRFYQKDRVWISRDGEGYGSLSPEMGRGELFRFIQEQLTSLGQALVGAIPKHIFDGTYNGALEDTRLALTAELSKRGINLK